MRNNGDGHKPELDTDSDTDTRNLTPAFRVSVPFHVGLFSAFRVSVPFCVL